MSTGAQIIPFEFETRQVRTLLVDGQPWFVAADVCLALGIVNSRRAAARLDVDEKGVHSMNTPGGDQLLGVVSESGLYALILTSRKTDARRFRKWVTAEVLPAIRKHGRYEDGAGQMGTLLGQVIGTDGFHVLASIVSGKVSHLPRPLQRGAKNHIWTQVHRAFSVNTVENIPATQFDAARNFVAAYVYEGEVIDKPTGFQPLSWTRPQRAGVPSSPGAPRSLPACKRIIHEIQRWGLDNFPKDEVGGNFYHALNDVLDLLDASYTHSTDVLLALSAVDSAINRLRHNATAATGSAMAWLGSTKQMKMEVAA